MANEIARKVNQHLSYATNLVGSAQQKSDRGLLQGLMTSACLQMELALGFYLSELQGKTTSGASFSPLTPDSIRAELENSLASNAREFLEVTADAASPINLLLKWVTELRHCSGGAELKNPLFSTDDGAEDKFGEVIFSSHSSIDSISNHIGGASPEQVKSVITFVTKFIVRQRQCAEEY